MLIGTWHEFKKESLLELGYTEDGKTPKNWRDVNKISDPADRAALIQMVGAHEKFSVEADACEECKARCGHNPSQGRCSKHFHDYTVFCGHEECPYENLLACAIRYWPDHYDAF